jgi:hypothetical protein
MATRPDNASAVTPKIDQVVCAHNYLDWNDAKPILKATVKAGSEESEVCHAEAFARKGTADFVGSGPLCALT